MKTTLYAILAILPAACIKRWGNGYTEPKQLLFFVLGAACLAWLFRSWGRTAPRLNAAAASLAGFLACQALAFGGAQNVGLGLQSLGLTLSALSVGLYVYNAGLDPRAVSAAVLASCCVPIAGALPMILARYPVVRFSPFGSTVGFKNSLSVLLAQTVPFTLLFLAGRAGAAPQLAAGSVLTLSFYVVFANRTRSAWWMIILYVAVLAWLYGRSKERLWGRLLLTTALCAAIAAALVGLLPNALRWKSDSPYLSSFASLASVERSSGRDQLWRVGARMALTNPVLGVGTGNYPPRWREYIKETSADPQVFAFLRPDLPLFNDYLQAAVENGLPSALFFLVFSAFLPALYFWRLTRADVKNSAAEVLLCLACLATSLDALFDSPFNRPETLFNFAVALGLAARRADRPLGISGRARAWRPALLIAAGGLVALAGWMGLGLSLRAWRFTGARSLELSASLWPWDAHWTGHHVFALERAGKSEAADALVRDRLRAWPFDPESHLIKASLLQRRRLFDASLAYYRRALIYVEGGRCYKPGYEAYLHLLEDPARPPKSPALTAVELAPCARIERSPDAGYPPL